VSAPNDPLAAGRDAAARVSNRPSGRHRKPEPEPAHVVAGITADTDIANPVNHYPANVFPVGAAITVAYGSVDDMWCTLGNLYRILGYLNQFEADDGVPVLTRGVSLDELNREVEDNVATIDDVIEQHRAYVRGELDGHGIPRPPAEASEGDKISWLANLATEHGVTTIRLDTPPRSD
jgi:hypothetical protein